jgi:hypothetical protein
MEFNGIPWNSMDNSIIEFHGKFHGIPWRIPWNFIKFHGIPFNSIEFAMEFHGKNIMKKIRQMFMKNFMEFHGKFHGM